MNRIEEIRSKLEAADPYLDGLLAPEDFEVSEVLSDTCYLLTQLDRCKKALEFYGIRGNVYGTGDTYLEWASESHAVQAGSLARITLVEVFGE